MKKSTLLISSLVLSTVLAFGQANRKASPIVKHNHINQTSNDNSNVEQRYANLPKTPSGHIRCITPEYHEGEEQFESWISEKIKEISSANNLSAKASRNIPVVVHILHNGDAVGSGENISVAQIQSQIDILNEDFSATNSDFSNVPGTFTGVAADSDIQFCLAQTDPSGQPTTGINRINVGVTSVSDTQIETNYGLNNMWDPTKYFNIFVGNLTGGLLGKAVFPTGSGLAGMPGGSAPSYDGVMVLYSAFGDVGSVSAPYNKGRTATHEIGHWLGLRHIWGDGTCATDYCNDTPTQQTANYNCRTHPYNVGQCSGNTTGEMFMNYMDYVPDACMYTFTADQKLRMDAVLANSPQRQELLTSTVCNAAAINADFTGTPLVINEGGSVTFTDASSSPDNLNSWVWSFPGGTPNSHTGQTPPAITYATQGQYDVTLTVGDDNAGSDATTKTMYITVNPAGTAICDSTLAGWDWNTEGFGGAYWGLDTDCAGNGAHDGYIMSNNCYDDNGWASIVPFSGTGKELTDVMYVFIQSSGSGATNLKIWNADGAGFSAANAAISTAPGTIMASASVSSGDFSANLNQFIALPITPAIPLSNDFYIGYDHPSAPASGDTLCMGVATGTSGNTTWAYEAGIGWRDIAFWGVDYKGTVVAVICDVATGEKEHLGDISQTIVYPNPTTGEIKIALPTKSASTVAVYNMIGEEIYSTTKNSNFIDFNLGDQPNGVYFVKVTSNGEVTTKKVLLSK